MTDEASELSDRVAGSAWFALRPRRRM